MCDDFFAGLLLSIAAIVILVTAGAGIFSLGQEHPNKYGKFRAVCEDRGGLVQDNTCISGDKVILRYKR